MFAGLVAVPCSDTLGSCTGASKFKDAKKAAAPSSGLALPLMQTQGMSDQVAGTSKLGPHVPPQGLLVPLHDSLPSSFLDD